MAGGDVNSGQGLLTAFVPPSPWRILNSPSPVALSPATARPLPPCPLLAFLPRAPSLPTCFLPSQLISLPLLAYLSPLSPSSTMSRFTSLL